MGAFVQGGFAQQFSPVEFCFDSLAFSLSKVCYKLVAVARRSALVAESLQKIGYKNVLSMAGGFKARKGTRIAGGEVIFA